jgi:Tol biopolymer transport system component
MKSGEAYFSPDAKSICFQSVRGDSPHYQIFLKHLDGTRLVRLSPGRGLTTCSYFHPNEERILWASTHLDPATFGPPPASTNRYVWDKHKSFDIFTSDLDGKDPIRLTDAPGYDAEGSYSPDGTRICFTSERDGDLEIYTMAADGSDVQRVTNSVGYDGGPFYSPDGKLITFRGFRDPDNPRFAQIYIIDADGKNEKQLTFDQAVNWAPYFHPNGKYLIYSKSMESHRAFSLFLVPVAGGESIRLTTTSCADILPVFSPDGTKVMWTSTRVGGISQLFIADFTLPDENNWPK